MATTYPQWLVSPLQPDFAVARIKDEYPEWAKPPWARGFVEPASEAPMPPFGPPQPAALKIDMRQFFDVFAPLKARKARKEAKASAGAAVQIPCAYAPPPYSVPVQYDLPGSAYPVPVNDGFFLSPYPMPLQDGIVAPPPPAVVYSANLCPNCSRHPGAFECQQVPTAHMRKSHSVRASKKATSPHIRAKKMKSRRSVDLDGHRSSSDSLSRRNKAKVKRTVVREEYISKHYCAVCGRSRSRRFQQDNPLKPGVIPAPGVCSRCRPSNSETTLSPPPPPKKPVAPKIPAPKGQVEVEEVVVQRGRRPMARRQQTRAFERDSSASPPPVRHHRRQKRTSDSWEDVKVVEETSRDPDLPARRASPILGPNARVVYRYRLADDQLRSYSPVRASAPIAVRESAPRRVVVRVRSRSREGYRARPLVVREDITSRSSNNRVTRDDSPPEYYLRQTRRYVEPVYANPPSSPPNQPPNRKPIPPPSTREPPPPERARDGQRRDAGYEGYRRVDYYSSEDDARLQRKPRVEFSKQTNGFGAAYSANEARAAHRQEEALQDWEEELQDQRRLDKIKTKVRHRVHEGGGAFEIDGHESGDHEGKASDDVEMERTCQTPELVSVITISSTHDAWDAQGNTFGIIRDDDPLPDTELSSGDEGTDRTVSPMTQKVQSEFDARPNRRDGSRQHTRTSSESTISIVRSRAATDRLDPVGDNREYLRGYTDGYYGQGYDDNGSYLNDQYASHVSQPWSNMSPHRMSVRMHYEQGHEGMGGTAGTSFAFSDESSPNTAFLNDMYNTGPYIRPHVTMPFTDLASWQVETMRYWTNRPDLQAASGSGSFATSPRGTGGVRYEHY